MRSGSHEQGRQGRGWVQRCTFYARSRKVVACHFNNNFPAYASQNGFGVYYIDTYIDTSDF